MRSLCLVVLALALSTSLLPEETTAGWAPDGNAIASLYGNQFPLDVVPDGSEGALVFWFGVGAADGHEVVTSWVKRVTADGATASGWPSAGLEIPIGDSLWMDMSAHADGEGGAFMARAAVAGYPSGPPFSVDVQHVSASGSMSAPVTYDAGAAGQVMPVFETDASDSPLLAWNHYSPPDFGLRLLGLSPSGSPASGWPTNGVAFGGSRSEDVVKVVGDGHGGAYVLTKFIAGLDAANLFLYRVDAGGVVSGWPDSGITVRTGVLPAIWGDDPMVRSGSGVIIVWTERRSNQDDVFCQRFLETGTSDPTWPADGVAAISGPFDQRWPFAVSDGADGVFIAGHGVDPPNVDLRVNRVLASGQVAAGWPSEGKIMRNPPSVATMGDMEKDGAGGFIVVWAEERVPDSVTIFAQRMDGNGAALWDTSGLVICDGLGLRGPADLTVDALGNSIAVWPDSRGGPRTDLNHWDVYGSRISASGAAGSPRISTSVSLGSPRPNPANATTAIRLELDRAQYVRARVLDVTGRVLRTLVDAVFPPGPTMLSWDGLDDDGHSVSQGIYFIQAQGEDETTSTRVAWVR